MIAIIDYEMGNLASVKKAMSKLNLPSIITRKIEDIKNSRGIILPGVGSFHQGMINLKKYNLIEILNQEVINKKKPFLGICLGLQLIMEEGSEPKPCRGLGWIKGSVQPIKNKKLSVPHLGWNNIYLKNENYKDDISNNYYFIHSYHVLPEEPVSKHWVNYEFPMVASILKENIFATQFHPEKSQTAGLELIKNYFKSIC